MIGGGNLCFKGFNQFDSLVESTGEERISFPKQSGKPAMSCFKTG